MVSIIIDEGNILITYHDVSNNQLKFASGQPELDV